MSCVSVYMHERNHFDCEYDDAASDVIEGS